MSDYSELEKQLRGRFLKVLASNPCGDVVDDLISIIKEDYVLLAKQPVSCRDCFSYIRRNGYPCDWCRYFQEYIKHTDKAYNCKHFLSGEEEARRSIVRFKSELTGEWILE